MTADSSGACLTLSRMSPGRGPRPNSLYAESCVQKRMSGARLSSVRKGSAGCALGMAPASTGVATRPLVLAMTVLGRHPAGLGGVDAAEANGVTDLLDLARVVVPVVVEHRTQIHVERDLVRAHELLEEGDARLALVELAFLEPVDVLEHPPPLSVQRVPEL